MKVILATDEAPKQVKTSLKLRLNNETQVKTKKKMSTSAARELQSVLNGSKNMIFSIRKESIEKQKQKAISNLNWTNLSPKVSFKKFITYKGNWLDGKRHGFGILINLEKSWIYRGNFSRNQKHGVGKLYKLTENKKEVLIYSGNFVNGQMSGQGKKFFISKRDKNLYILKQKVIDYEGEFLNGKMEGFGKAQLSEDVYEGCFINNQPHGEGLLKLKNGESYKGKFFEGQKFGKGKRTFEYGTLQGIWENGNPIRGMYLRV